LHLPPSPQSALKGKYPLIAALVLLLVAPVISPNQYVIHVLTLCFVLGLASLGWNIAYGYGGLFAFGHAAFFGLGAYVTVMLLLFFRLTPWVGILVGGVASAILGVALTYLTARTYGFYFAIVTAALPAVLFVVVTYFSGITGGSFGMPVPFYFSETLWQSVYYMEFNSLSAYYYISLLFLLSSCVTVYMFDRSRLGYYTKAMGLDIMASEAIGIDTFRVKMICIIFSAFLTAVAGGLYAVLLHFIDPYTAFGPLLSLQLILNTMFGGVGTIAGPLIGTFVTEVMSELMKTYLERWIVTGVHVVLYGLVLMATILLLPSGVYPSLRHFLSKHMGVAD
jgi:branched-chain amino acid transport system permease protein